MELQRTAHSMLRTHLTPFLNAASHQTCHSRNGSRPRCSFPLLRHQGQNVPHRTISTLPPREAQAAARREENDEPPSQSARSNQPSQRVRLAQQHTSDPPLSPDRPRKRADNMEFLRTAASTSSQSQPQNRAPQRNPSATVPNSSTNQSTQFNPARSLGSLDFLKPRTPRPASPTGTMTPTQPNERTSVDELLSQSRPQSVPYRPGDRSRFDVLGLMTHPGRLQRTPAEEKKESDKKRKDYEKTLERTMAAPGFRLGPGLGRTVSVDTQRGMDVARAFQMVNVKCAANSVRQDVVMQKFHERPGARRKRLASVRYRRRFKEGFRATVRRVEEMRRKGW